MNQLLKQEKILFDSMMNKETDKDTISAFYDYANFLSKKEFRWLHIYIKNSKNVKMKLLNTNNCMLRFLRE